MYREDKHMHSSTQIKCQLHNTRQQIKSLRKRRKQLRGRLNAARMELSHAESVLSRCEEELRMARERLVELERIKPPSPVMAQSTECAISTRAEHPQSQLRLDRCHQTP